MSNRSLLLEHAYERVLLHEQLINDNNFLTVACWLMEYAIPLADGGWEGTDNKEVGSPSTFEDFKKWAQKANRNIPRVLDFLVSAVEKTPNPDKFVQKHAPKLVNLSRAIHQIKNEILQTRELTDETREEIREKILTNLRVLFPPSAIRTVTDEQIDQIHVALRKHR